MAKPLDTWAIGKMIQKYRRTFKMSQEELAEAVGVDASMISKIENGRKSNLPVDLLMQIAGAFHVTMDALCYDAAAPDPEEEEGTLLSDQREAVRILEKLSDLERGFLMKMLRGAVHPAHGPVTG